MASTLFPTEETLAKFWAWADEQLPAAHSENAGKRRHYRTWRRHKDIRPEQEEKSYPWAKASNVAVPLANIIAQGTYGQLRGVFNVKDPFWTITSMKGDGPEAEDDQRRANTLTRLFNLMSENPRELDMRRRKRTILNEFGLMGTCWVKVDWVRQVWQFRTGSGAESSSQEGDLHWGPAVIPVPVEDVLYRSAIQDPSRAQWIGHRFLVHSYEIEDWMAQGAVDSEEALKVLTHGQDKPQEWRKDIMRRMGTSSLPDDIHELIELRLRWDVNGDRKSEECIMLIHQPSRAILQDSYNETGLRMLTPAVYVERPFFIEGMGTGWLTESMQEEADTTHNMRINAMHLTTFPIFVGRSGSGLKATEFIRPGKLFLLQNPTDLIMLGPLNVPPTTIQSEQISREYAQLAAGIPDAKLGFADTVARTRDTFRGQESRLAQQGHMFSSIVESAEDAFSEIGFHIFVTMVAHRDEVLQKEGLIGRLSAQEMQDLEATLNIPLKDIPQRFAFAVRTTDLDQTYDVKRQNLLFMVQLQSQFYEKMVPVLMQMNHPQMPPQLKVYLGRMFTASMRTLDRVMTFFGETEKSKYVPEYKKLEMLVEVQELLMGAQYEMQARQLLQMLGGGGVNGSGQGNAAGNQRFAGRGAVPAGAGGVPAGATPVEAQGAGAPAGFGAGADGQRGVGQGGPAGDEWPA